MGVPADSKQLKMSEDTELVVREYPTHPVLNM